jgi:hypothetical protein
MDSQSIAQQLTDIDRSRRLDECEGGDGGKLEAAPGAFGPGGYPERRLQLDERLALAKTTFGPLDPLTFFEEWKAPEERYKSEYE